MYGSLATVLTPHHGAIPNAVSVLGHTSGRTAEAQRLAAAFAGGGWTGDESTNGELAAKIGKDPDLPKYRAGLEMAKRNLKTLSDAGVRIAFGTDSGLPTRFAGFFEHRELLFRRHFCVLQIRVHEQNVVAIETDVQGGKFHEAAQK